MSSLNPPEVNVDHDGIYVGGRSASSQSMGTNHQIHPSTSFDSSHVNENNGMQCSNCNRLQSELDTLKQKHETDFKMLKEKIISTDLLIKKYSSKCQECDTQTKQLEETSGKLNKSQKEWNSMAEQLKAALADVEPLRKAKERHEKKHGSYIQEIEDLQIRIKCFEAEQRQLTANNKEFDIQKKKIEDEHKQAKLKTKEAETSLKKKEIQLKKTTDELEQKKTVCKELRKQNTALTKSNEKLETRLAKAESILQEYGLLCELGKKRKTPASSINTETSYQEALSSGDEDDAAIERIFTELGVFDNKRQLLPIIPALSPIPSPCPLAEAYMDDNDVPGTSEMPQDVREPDEILEELLEEGSPGPLASSDEEENQSDQDEKMEEVDVPFPSYTDSTPIVAGTSDPVPKATSEVSQVMSPMDYSPTNNNKSSVKKIEKLYKDDAHNCEQVDKLIDDKSSIANETDISTDSLVRPESNAGDMVIKGQVSTPCDIRSIPTKLNIKPDGEERRISVDSQAASSQDNNKSESKNAECRDSSHKSLVPPGSSALARRKSFCKQDSLDMESENPEPFNAVEGSESDNTEAKKALCRQNATAFVSRQPMTSTDTKLMNNSNEAKSKVVNAKSIITKVNFVVGSSESSGSSGDSPASESQIDPKSNKSSADEPDSHNALTKQGSFPFSVTLSDDMGNSDSDSQSKVITGAAKSRRISLSRKRDVSIEESGIDSPLACSYGFNVEKAGEQRSYEMEVDVKPNISGGSSTNIAAPGQARAERNKSVQLRSESVDSGMGNDVTAHPVPEPEMPQAPAARAEGTSWVPVIPEEIPNPPSPAPSHKSDVSETHSIYNFIDFDEFNMANPISPLPPSPVNVMQCDEDETEVKVMKKKQRKVKKDISGGKQKLKKKKRVLVAAQEESVEKETMQIKMEETEKQPVSVSISAVTQSPAVASGQTSERKVIQIDPVALPPPEAIKKKTRAKIMKRKSDDMSECPPVKQPALQKTVVGNEVTEKENPRRIPSDQEIKNLDIEIQNVIKYDMKISEVVRRITTTAPSPPTELISQRITQVLSKTELDLLPTWCFKLDKGALPNDKGWLSKPEFKIMSLLHSLSRDKKHGTITVDMLVSCHEFFSHLIAGKNHSLKGATTVCRVYVALCRISGNIDRPRVLAYDFIHKQVSGYISLLVAMTAIWPDVLTDDENSPSEEDLLLTIMKHGCYKCLVDENIKHQKMMQCFSQLCSWKKPSKEPTAIAGRILSTMQKDRLPTDVLFKLGRGLGLLAVIEGWTWTNNVLLLEMIWPSLQRWVVQPGSSNISDAYIETIVRFIGSLGRIYRSSGDEASETMSEVMKMLATLIYGLPDKREVPEKIQIAAVDSLLTLAPFSPDVVGSTIQYWMGKTNRIPHDLTEKFATFTEHYTSIRAV